MKYSLPPLNAYKIFILIAVILAVLFMVTAATLFQRSGRLRKRKEETGDSTPLKRSSLLLLLFCYVAPFVDYRTVPATVSRVFHQEIKEYDVGSDIQYMDSSPDGKFLALGAQKGLFVWDVDSRTCVWSDDSINARRVRFSDSGKYLAGMGAGRPFGQSDLVVYEVGDFKRLSHVILPSEQDAVKTKRALDIAFASDDRSVSMLWYEDWHWEELSPDDRIRADRKKSELTSAPMRVHDRYKQKIYYAEILLDSGRETGRKPIADVHYGNSYGVRFLPGTRKFLYSRGWERDDGWKRERIIVVNVDDLTEDIFQIGPKYDVAVSVFRVPEGQEWVEGWAVRPDGEHVYVLVGGGNLAELDLPHHKIKSVIPLSGEGLKGYLAAWIRVAMSPDEKKAALLGFGESYSFNGVRYRDITLRIVDLKTEESYLVVRRGFSKASIGWHVVWIRENTLAVSQQEYGTFAFIDILEGQK
jgi:hypothetical protein